MRTAVVAFAYLALLAAGCTTIATIPPQVVSKDDPEPRTVKLSEMCADMGWEYDSGPGVYDYTAKGPRGDKVTFIIDKDIVIINDTRFRQERDAVEIKGRDLMLPESTYNFVAKHFGMYHLVRGGKKSPALKYEMQPIEPPAKAAPEQPAAKATSSALRGLTLCIDPGHGAHNVGGEAFGVQEKVVVLNVSKMLKELCEQAGAKVVMTRTSDVFVELDQRCEIANKAGCDLFLSVHANIAPGNGEVDGFEAFFNPESKNGERFAKALISAMDAATDAPNRGAKERVLRVLDKTKMPAVLFEMGFLSNKAEGKKLASEEYQRTLAKALYNGILADWSKRASVSR